MSFNIIMFPVLFIVGAFCLFFYMRNLLKAAGSLRNGEYSIKLALRAFGIFFPVVGVFMGLVP